MLFLIGLGIFALNLIVANEATRRQHRKSRPNFIELMNKWGLEEDGKKKGKNRYFRASGFYKGYFVILLERGTGTHYFPCVTVICHKTVKKKFYICPEKSISRNGWNIGVGKKLGILNDVIIGDPIFDKFFYIECKDKNFIREILKEDVTKDLHNLFRRAVADSPTIDFSINLTLNHHELMYTEEGKNTLDENMKERFAMILETMIVLAEKIDSFPEEVLAKKRAS